ncbi:MAG: asparagine synthase (glutamine-hydrolyzing) [Acidobacteriota bacterium]
MCGIAGLLGPNMPSGAMRAMLDRLRHRGPDGEGEYHSPGGPAALGHTRLKVIDLSPAGQQPMADPTGRFWIVYNGEVYNYLELKNALSDWPFRSQTDTEVVLAAFVRWGAACLERLIGMFAFCVWDEKRQELFAARDRFGVKPFFYHVTPSGGLLFASEIKALHAAGVPREPEQRTWAAYLARGLYDHDERTFWRGVYRLQPGSLLRYSVRDGTRVERWYDLRAAFERVGEDDRCESLVEEELLGLLEESVRLRFRSDVPVGLCLSGGLDSSLVLALVRKSQGEECSLKTFTFTTGDPAYDETPWVRAMLRHTRHVGCFCPLSPSEVPALMAEVQAFQDEPFGGIPTLGMARVHARARDEGVTVLLDGNGMDEAWCGYDYYTRPEGVDIGTGPVQGAVSRSTPRWLAPEFAELASQVPGEWSSGDRLRSIQLHDLCVAKIPRAMRFADRVSMQFSRELREPFLDHRLVELGLRQRRSRKVRDGVGKWLPRTLARALLPGPVREAPKRALQTPQREWLRGPLRAWACDQIEGAIQGWGASWLDASSVRSTWTDFLRHGADSSFTVWQWINLGLLSSGSRGLDG